MGDKTGISWCDASWNPIRGCSRVSEGCRHCYAETMAARFSGPGQPYEGLVKLVTKEKVLRRDFADGSVELRKHETREARWTGEVRFIAEHLADPLKWKRPRRIFVNSMSDLFHEKLTNEQIAAVFGVMAAAPQHTFQCLTKRPKRMREWFEWALDGTARSGFYDATFLNNLTSKAGLDWESHPKWLAHCEETEDTCSAWPLPNVWLGTSIENRSVLHRLDDLRACPAALRFVSAEPLLEGLGDIDISGIGWVIAGCESGPGARPCDVGWLRSLRDQCAAAETAFFLKQAQEVPVRSPVPIGEAKFVGAGPGSKRKPGGIIELPYLDGVKHAAFPEVRS